MIDIIGLYRYLFVSICLSQQETKGRYSIFWRMSIHQPWQSIWLPLDSFQGYADLWYINIHQLTNLLARTKTNARFPCGCQRHWRTQNRHESVWLVNFIQQRKAKIHTARSQLISVISISETQRPGWKDLPSSAVGSTVRGWSGSFIILMAGGWLLPRKCLSTNSFFQYPSSGSVFYKHDNNMTPGFTSTVHPHPSGPSGPSINFTLESVAEPRQQSAGNCLLDLLGITSNSQQQEQPALGLRAHAST
jgi:hypothetical protein